MNDADNQRNDESEELVQLSSDELPDADLFDLDFNICEKCGCAYRGSNHKCRNKET